MENLLVALGMVGFSTLCFYILGLLIQFAVNAFKDDA